MALKTFAEMNTLLADNTTGDISEGDMRDVIKGLWRRQIAPYTVDNAADVYWESNLGDFTAVTPSGSQTVTEREGFLSVVFAGQSSGHLNARLKAVSFSVGDEWACEIENIADTPSGINWVGLIATDGTATTSNFWGAFPYHTSAPNAGIGYGHGVLNSVNTLAAEIIDAHTYHGNPVIRLKYTATNEYRVDWSADGVSWIPGTARAKTMTPTHIGVGWSRYGGGGNGMASFGPLCKLA